MYGYIYETTNLVNGKKYIGQHRAEKLDENYFGSSLIFLRALNKYGKENFSVKVLEECFSENELNEKEIYYISKYNAVADRNYYNTSFGGESNSRNMKTMYNKELDKVIMSADCNIDYYKSLGYELGMRPRSEEAKENYRKAKKNKIPITNEETTKYISRDDIIPDGWRIGWPKVSETDGRRKHRKWMNKDGKSTMVEESDIQKYLNEGYEFGRTHFEYHRDFEKNPVWNKGKCISKKTT